MALSTNANADVVIPCRIATLSERAILGAADIAVAVNPANRVVTTQTTSQGIDPRVLTPYHLASMTGKLWKPGTVISVGFLDNPDSTTRRLILAHANIWRDKGTNISFVESVNDPMVRIARYSGSGYWSYLGTDCLSVPASQQTMNLEGFTANTSDAEYTRVVCHEFGHVLSFSHEQNLPEIQAMLDPQKVIAYYMRWQGWDEQTIRDQILDPLPTGSYTSTSHADVLSIMMYPFPKEVTRNGVAIPGGNVIDDSDAAFAAGVYPGTATPPGMANPMTAQEIYARIKGAL